MKPHNPPGPDPKILLLDAIVHAPTGVVAQVFTKVPVNYFLPGSSPPPRPAPYSSYEKVIILPDNLVLIIRKTH